MDSAIIVKLHKNFEGSVHKAEGVEFWYARELQELLGYSSTGSWKNFLNVVEKAKTACRGAGQTVSHHFVKTVKMVDFGKGGQRKLDDIMLTRYACYLIAQNGDSRKDEVAFAMTYFAVQTRKQEVIEARLAEYERLHYREKLTSTEKAFSGILFDRGIDSHGFARIRSKGDEALFGGYNTQDIKNKFNIPKNRPLADFLPTVTIKAKDFATAITNFKVKKLPELKKETDITKEHVKNNNDVRGVLIKNSIIPEELPPAQDTKKLKQKLKTEDKTVLNSSQQLSLKSLLK